MRQRKRIGAAIAAKRNIEATLETQDMEVQCKSKNFTADEESEMIHAVQFKKAAAFGLVKLAGYNLNRPLQSLGCTLLFHTASLQRDSITSALLRAGSDPSILHPSTPTPIPTYPARLPNIALVRHMWRLPMAYAVWLTNLHASLAAAVMAAPAATDLIPTLICQHCTKSHPTLPKTNPNPDPTNPVLSPPCGHLICSQCFWAAVLRASAVLGALCPCCCVVLGALSGGEQVSARGGLFPWMQGEDPSQQSDLDALYCEICRLLCAGQSLDAAGVTAWSHARYLSLPCDDNPLNPKTNTPQPQAPSVHPMHTLPHPHSSSSRKFCALPLKVLHSRSLGRTRPQRTQQLLQASASGNTTRLIYLIVSGVDIETANEYGQTACFLAAWKGHRGVVSILKSMGARDVPDPIGVRPSDFAAGRTLAKDPVVRPLLPPTLPSLGYFAAGHLNHPGSDAAPWGCLPHPVLTTHLPTSATHAGAGSFHIDSCFSEDFLSFLASLPDQCLCLSPAEKACCSDRYYWCDTMNVLLRAVKWVLGRVRDGDGNGGRADVPCRGILPFVRFLVYRNAGGSLPPHIDLCRSENFYLSPGEGEEGKEVSDASQGENSPPHEPRDGETEICTITSTHTFLLYLTTCENGGETALLHRLPPPTPAPHLLSAKKERKWKQEQASQDSPPQTLFEGSNTIAAVKPVRGRLLFFPHACPHEGRLVECVPKMLIRGEMY